MYTQVVCQNLETKAILPPTLLLPQFLPSISCQFYVVKFQPRHAKIQQLTPPIMVFSSFRSQTTQTSLFDSQLHQKH